LLLATWLYYASRFEVWQGIWFEIGDIFGSREFGFEVADFLATAALVATTTTASAL